MGGTVQDGPVGLVLDHLAVEAGPLIRDCHVEQHLRAWEGQSRMGQWAWYWTTWLSRLALLLETVMLNNIYGRGRDSPGWASRPGSNGCVWILKASIGKHPLRETEGEAGWKMARTTPRNFSTK